MAFEELKVEGEDGVWFCYRHKSTTTRLRCGRCEKPICPKCTQYGPTGARCRDCLSNRDLGMYQAPPRVLAIAFGVGGVAGGIGAALSGVLGILWLFALLYAPAIGPVLGRFITKVTGGKRGIKVALATMLGVGSGALAIGLLLGTIATFVFWIMLVIALVGVFGYLR
jgi:hypothetical protein